MEANTPIRTVSIRDFYANMKKYSTLVTQGETLVVTKNRRDLFRVIPIPATKKYSRADLLDLPKLSGTEVIDTDLSQRVDEIVYGN